MRTPVSHDLFPPRELLSGRDVTEEELHRLEAIRRLLLRVDAIRAVSWLWPSAVPYIAGSPAELAGRNKKTSPTSLTAMLPMLRRRIRRRGVLQSALFRYVENDLGAVQGDKLATSALDRGSLSTRNAPLNFALVAASSSCRRRCSCRDIGAAQYGYIVSSF